MPSPWQPHVRWRASHNSHSDRAKNAVKRSSHAVQHKCSTFASAAHRSTVIQTQLLTLRLKPKESPMLRSHHASPRSVLPWVLELDKGESRRPWRCLQVYMPDAPILLTTEHRAAEYVKETTAGSMISSREAVQKEVLVN